MYCVFGNPIQHSKSPRIHKAFAEQTQQEMLYEARLAPLDTFEETIKKFFQAEGQGCNITVPFKERAWQMAEIKTPRAEKAGAVNTLWKNPQGQLCADNTDGVGLVRDLKNAGHSLNNKRILVLGAGGAVRGVLSPLLAEQPEKIYIYNRTAAKAQALVDIFSDEGTIAVIDDDALKNIRVDIIINGTSASLSGDLPALPSTIFAENALAYDMMYGAKPTIFLEWAAQHGAQTQDGLGMLVEQAAEAFFIWRHVHPETQQLLNTLRSELR